MVRKIKAKLVLRLRSEGLSRRQIAAQGMSRHSVDAVIAAADAVGLSYDEAAGMPEADVYARLFPGRGQHESVYAQPDWSEVWTVSSCFDRRTLFPQAARSAADDSVSVRSKNDSIARAGIS